MTSMDLNWRAEEACMSAWPSPRQMLLSGWLLRAAGGSTRRTNSVNPLRGGPRDPAAILAAAEATYAALGQTALFRVPSIAAEMDGPLAAGGYTAEGETLTLFNDLSAWPQTQGTATRLTAEADGDWLQARAALSPADTADSAVFETMVSTIMLPRIFAATRHEGAVVALAYGVLHDGLAVVEAVVTDARWRQRGFGRQTVGAVLNWAVTAGAGAACLQVVADNPAALALYRSLGFTTELYRYHYRRKSLPL